MKRKQRNLPTPSRIHPTLSIIWGVVLLLSTLSLWLRIEGDSFDSNLYTILPKSQTADIRSVFDQLQSRQNRQLLIAVYADKAIAPAIRHKIENALQSTDVSIDTFAQSQRQIAELYQTLLPYRQQLLTRKDHRALAQNATATVIQNAQKKLYGFSTLSPEQLRDDPLFLFQRFFQQLLPKKLAVDRQGNWLLIDKNNLNAAILPLTINGSAFDTRLQQRLIYTIAQASIIANDANMTLDAVGTVIFAAHGYNQSQREISTVGLGGMIGILGLLLYVFRTVRPLALLFTSLGFSLVVALNASLMAFGSVHILSMLLSVALIGVSIDYGLHFLTDVHQHRDHPRNSIARILPGLTLGLLSSVFAYALFLTGDMSLLRQVALFAIVGLTSMFFTVVLICPYLYKRRANSEFPPLLTALAAALFDNPVAHWFRRLGVFITAFALALLAYFYTNPNDDIRDLQARPHDLIQQEAKLRQAFQQPQTQRYVLLTHANIEKLAQAEKTLLKDHHTAFEKNIPLAELIPPVATQKENVRFYDSLYKSPDFNAYNAQIGGIADARVSPFSPIPTKMFYQTLAELKHFSRRYLALPDGRFALLMPLKTTAKATNFCGSIAAFDNCFAFSPVDDLSSAFGHYREQLSKIVFTLCLIVFAFALWRYRRRGVYVGLIPFFSALCALSASSALGLPVNLFSCLSALLIIGIGLDYVIFLSEHANPKAVMIPICLSYLTTLLSFGLLAFSQTAAVATFGLCTAIGMTITVLLAPAVVSGPQLSAQN